MPTAIAPASLSISTHLSQIQVYLSNQNHMRDHLLIIFVGSGLVREIWCVLRMMRNIYFIQKVFLGVCIIVVDIDVGDQDLTYGAELARKRRASLIRSKSH